MGKQKCPPISRFIRLSAFLWLIALAKSAHASSPHHFTGTCKRAHTGLTKRIVYQRAFSYFLFSDARNANTVNHRGALF